MKILNADPEFARPLSENEIRNFLTDTKLNIHIATIDDKGHPNIHPAWYYFDSTNYKLYVETAKNSKKVENLRRRDNIIYYCVDVPCLPYKGVRGKGRVRIHVDVNHNIPIAEKIMVRYLGSLAHPIATSIMSSVKNGDSVILEITPIYYSTWDLRQSSRLIKKQTSN